MGWDEKGIFTHQALFHENFQFKFYEFLIKEASI